MHAKERSDEALGDAIEHGPDLFLETLTGLVEVGRGVKLEEMDLRSEESGWRGRGRESEEEVDAEDLREEGKEETRYQLKRAFQ
jgi:hypothetical protein